MRSTYWILAFGVVAALLAAAWFARQLSDDTAAPIAARDAIEDGAKVVAAIEPEQTIFEAPELDTQTAPTFDIVRISRNGTGVVAGRGEAGKTVDLLVNGEAVANAMADINREWVIILAKPLPSGALELSLSTVGADGKRIYSENIVVVDVPKRGDAGVLAVLSPRSGTGPSQPLQVPSESSNALLKLHIASIDILSDDTAVASGLAGAGDALRIYVNNAYINEVVADEEGAWQLSLGVLPDDVEHELRVDQISQAQGDVGLRIVQPFNAEAAMQPSDARRAVVVRRGNNLWAIARQVYGGGELFSLIFEQNAAQIRNPDLIYPGQVFDLPLEPATVTQ
ncbi:MAG: LysM peptidoglycan-binding domain-containing protein [Pseudomonadota bacterium]